MGKRRIVERIVRVPPLSNGLAEGGAIMPIVKEAFSSDELEKLVRNVFSLGPSDRKLAVLTDVPGESAGDNAAWSWRRLNCRAWVQQLDRSKATLGLDEVALLYYPSVGSHNADLPKVFYVYDGDPAAVTREKLERHGHGVERNTVFARYQVMLAPTEFSTTAPLKIGARKYNFRAATMPGFSKKMISALKLDYAEVNRRVGKLKKLLDEALLSEIMFRSEGDTHKLSLDLRFRTAWASGGFLPRPGTAGNLPSGEAYIVPYEGERKDKSLSEGILPVQFGEEVVLYRIRENRAVEVLSQGEKSDEQRRIIEKEPYYGNIAELGFGILRDFGVLPTGDLLLDEKLGLHVAFGRSDHLGGIVGAEDFRSPKRVIHVDRIYIPETQPLIRVEWVKLSFEDENPGLLMEDGRYTIF
jgi:hypothetical protein